VRAAAAFAGSGAIALAGRLSSVGAASFAGAGDFSPGAAARAMAAFAAAGAGALAGTAAAQKRALVAFAGAGSLSGAGHSPAASTAAFAGAGAFAPSGRAASIATASFAGAGALAASGRTATTGTIALAGAGSLAVVPRALLIALVALAGAGAFRARGQRLRPPTAADAARALFANRGRLVLYEDLPLRTTRVLGDFADDAILAHRYGDLTAARFTLLRLSDTKFFVADHPMLVAAVFIDGQETHGWEQRLESDGAGHTWTIIELTAPAPVGTAISATGTGKRNPTTGALLENPAEIIEDVLRIAGRIEQWGGLRAECAAASIRLAGSVDEVRSIRAWIDAIAESAGAIWSGQEGRLYPVESVAPPVLKLEQARATITRVSASLPDTADILRLGYDESKAGGRMQHSIELTASPLRFGGLVYELELPWLRTSANAEAIGRRWLSRLAGERYDVTFSTDATDTKPGRWIELVRNPGWEIPGADPVIMALSVELSDDDKSVVITGETILQAPEIRVSSYSVALPNTRDASVELEIKDGNLYFTVRDAAGKPVADARVNIDGGPARKTDAKGLVSFPNVPKGEHTLAVQAPGKRAELVTITI
jgi:hypothetical protein